MAEDITHPIHNPFDVPPPKRGKGFLIAGLLAVLLHVILGVDGFDGGEGGTEEIFSEAEATLREKLGNAGDVGTEVLDQF